MNTIVNFYLLHSDNVFDGKGTIEEATKKVHEYFATLPVSEKLRTEQAYCVYKVNGITRTIDWDVESWKHALAVEAQIKKFVGNFGNVSTLISEPNRIMINCDRNHLKLDGLLNIIADCGYKTSISFILDKIFIRVC